MSESLAITQKAIANLDARIKNINACINKQQEALSDHAYTKNKGVVKNLVKDSDNRLETLKQEKEIRQELAQAQAAGDKKKIDVAKKKLSELAKKNPNYYSKQKSKDPCFKCGAGLKGLRDPAYPVWVTWTDKNPYGGGWKFEGNSQLAITKYKGWDDLIKSGKKTASEKNVINSVASNEGKFDSVQSYDRVAVSSGVMQKNVRLDGEGELPTQIAKFKENYPDKYKKLFEAKGWIVRKDVLSSEVVNGKTIRTLSDNRLYYKDPDNPAMSHITGTKLKGHLCQKMNPESAKKAMTPLKQAGEDPDFQKQQVMDFNARLLKLLNNNDKRPTGYKYPIGSYITSERGTALALDQSVNAPSNVSPNLGQALDKFYLNNPGADKNPANWPDTDQQKYEDEILKYYKSHRNMKDSEERCQKIINNENLSDNVLSMELPE